MSLKLRNVAVARCGRHDYEVRPSYSLVFKTPGRRLNVLEELAIFGADRIAIRADLRIDDESKTDPASDGHAVRSAAGALT